MRPLAEALQGSGLRVWFDQWSLVLGDRLRRQIDEASNARASGSRS
ncbi:MAG: toll/interleukin-1 receptor domain-containing protein [Gemmatimonadaceae bacterium]|nr:toll/interleukin-1 receptor domain-containing protein [Gemmatimonadaceae bacterium]